MINTHVPSIASEPGSLALLVDRDDDTRRMYAQVLALACCAVEEASDGREALAKAIARQPDVIVTETRLPGISGYDLCGLLRLDAATREIPIVVVTADAFAEDVQRARDVGADVVLVKPCLPERLASEVASVIETARSLPQRSSATPFLTRTPEAKGKVLSRAHLRHDTTTPPIVPPTLVCPQCDQPLVYKRSHVGGVSARYAEQWDYFECATGCGTFQYRERTRKLRKAL